MAMLPSTFYVRLQYGITGGFMPPTPSAIHAFSRAEDSPAHLVVSSAGHLDGSTPGSLGELAPPKKISVDSHTALIEELYDILKVIPTEFPPGSQDIYGLDTGIAWGSKDFQWCNGGPAGCGSGVSERQATEEDKQKFKRAVDILHELTTKEG